MEKRLQELRYFDKVETLSPPGPRFPDAAAAGRHPADAGPGAILPGAQESVGRGRVPPAGRARAVVHEIFRRPIFRSPTRCRRVMPPRARPRSPRSCASGCSAVPASRRVTSRAKHAQKISSHSSYQRARHPGRDCHSRSSTERCRRQIAGASARARSRDQRPRACSCAGRELRRPGAIRNVHDRRGGRSLLRLLGRRGEIRRGLRTRLTSCLPS
jgi:hypothetical protein